MMTSTYFKKTVLITLISFLPILLSFNSSDYFSNQKQSRSKSIIVRGKITDLENNAISMAKIEAVVNNSVNKTIYADLSGNYELLLERGLKYSINFHKYGYASKIIEFSTEKVSEEDLKYGVFPTTLNLSLFEYYPELDISALSKPVSKFYYSDYEGDFLFDEPYTFEMEKQVNRIISNLKQIKRKQYDKYISQGDAAYKSGQLENAWIDYLNALSVYPKENYPTRQINNIRKELNEQANAEQSYINNVSKGDRNYNRQNYKISRSYYQKSLIYKPNEDYPQSQIVKIENMLTGNNLLDEKDEVDDIDEEELVEHKISKEETVEAEEVAAEEVKMDIVNIAESPKINKIEREIVEEKNVEVKSEIADNALVTVHENNEILEEKVKRRKEKVVNNNAKENLQVGVESYRAKQYDKALENFSKAYDYFEDQGMVCEQAAVAETMADLYYSMYRYTAASDWYARSNYLYTTCNNREKSVKSLLKAAEASYSSGDFDQALTRYMQFLNLPEIEKQSDLASVYNSIGVIHFEMDNHDEAIKYYNLSMQNAEKTNNFIEKGLSLNNIGNIKYEIEEYNAALNYYNQSIETKTLIDYKAGIAVSLHNIANVFRKTGEYSKALEYYEKSEKFAIASGNTDVIYENYGALAEVYSKTNDCKNAIYYSKLYSETRHLITRKPGKGQITESAAYYLNMLEQSKEIDDLRDEIRRHKILAEYEAARKEKEIKYLSLLNSLAEQQLKTKDYQVKLQRSMIFVAVAGFFILLLFFFVLSRQYRQKKIANRLLAEQNIEINAQNHEIESQRDMLYEQKEKIEIIHSELTDSIKYARRIQNAVLNTYVQIPQIVSEHFMIFKPLSMVSGDFFWVSQKNNKLIICIADCTGHGVPGAFMSMLGVSFLNEIVQKENITNPAEILNVLRDDIIKSLGQKEVQNDHGISNVRDGMDIALCSINIDSLELEFAGANNSLYIVNSLTSKGKASTKKLKAELVELKGDKMPVALHERMDKFNTKTYKLSKGDVLYMFTDGFSDQFGGPKGRKFMSKVFKQMLVDISQLPMSNQQNEIEKRYNEWISYNNAQYEQVDDITIMGIRIA